MLPLSRIALGCTLLFLFPAPDAATAQNRSDRYVIRVYEDGDACRYQIQDQIDQDVFHILPTGSVQVKARGSLWVDVTVQDDARGTPGTRSRRSVALRDANEGRTLTARSALGRSTEHKVSIQCCPTRRGRSECPQWIDAQPPPTTTGRAEPSDDLLPSHGPSAGAPPPPTHPSSQPPQQPAGGPTMRVEEN